MFLQNNSCSLVDIPTYLCHPVQLVTVTYDNTGHTRPGTILSPGHLVTSVKKPPTKTKWTLCCIAVWFLVVCIGLVGTMLSYTTEYQDRAVARSMFYNVNNTIIDTASSQVSVVER